MPELNRQTFTVLGLALCLLAGVAAAQPASEATAAGAQPPRAPATAPATTESPVTTAPAHSASAAVSASPTPAQPSAAAGAQVTAAPATGAPGAPPAESAEAQQAPAVADEPATGTHATSAGDAAGAAEDDSDPELASLLSQVDESAAIEQVIERDTFSIYGFADFTFERLWAGGSVAALYPEASFYIGNLNVYLDAQLDDHWRSLAEIRFTYLPHGSLDTSTGRVVDTNALDYSDALAEARIGGIEIERAWLDYAPFPWLAVRAGQWLTPYGIWNVDHGSPALLGIGKPYVNSVKMLPERQTGLTVRSTIPLSDSFDLTLHATLSNGRGAIDEYRDLDSNKALGGRAVVNYLGDARIQLGTSVYKGRYTEAETDIMATGDEVAISLTPTVRFDEVSVAGDLRVQWEGFDLLVEAAMNEMAFVSGLRPGGVVGLSPSPQPDVRRWGMYALFGYNIEPLRLMPFVGFDHIDDTFTTGVLNLYRGGLRFTPIANVTLKGEYTHAVPELSLTRNSTIKTLRFQAAWAFQ